MLVLVGSRNPVKTGAVAEVFASYFGDVEVRGVEVESGVPAQPVGDETWTGARNRALALLDRSRAEGLGAAYCAGLEGGIAQLAGRWYTFGVICIASDAGACAFGVSPMFELPPAIVDRLLAGEELGHVIDDLSGAENTKQKGGAIAYFTAGRVDRRQLYAQGAVMALVPFLNAAIYDAAAAA
ncbi:MAG: inosine/xanthosine triphosphatase [Anaerolineae bacterium]|nr:inosine/xanthosine triphosphatase [Anaerolineae bacterium]